CGSLYKKLLISRLQRRGGAVKSIGKSLPLMALVAHEAGASIRLVARAGGIPTSRAYNLIRHGQAGSPGGLLAGAPPTTERKEVTMTTALQAPSLSLLDSGLRLVAFKINRTFWEGMSDEELYEPTRFAWRTNPHLHDPDLDSRWHTGSSVRCTGSTAGSRPRTTARCSTVSSTRISPTSGAASTSPLTWAGRRTRSVTSTASRDSRFARSTNPCVRAGGDDPCPPALLGLTRSPVRGHTPASAVAPP